MNLQKLKSPWIGFPLGLAIFVILLSFLDWRTTWTTLIHSDWRWLALAVALAFTSQAMNLGKLYGLARPVGIAAKAKEFVPIYASLTVGGMVVPWRSGELVMSLVWKNAQGKLLALTLLNRVVEGTITVILSIITVSLFIPQSLMSVRWFLFAASLAICAFLIYLLLHERTGFWCLRQAKRSLQFFLPARGKERIESWSEPIRRELGHFYASTRAFVSPRIFTPYLALTLLLRAIWITATYSLFRTVGVEMSFQVLFGFLIVSWVGLFVAPTPAGLGVGDIPSVAYLAHFGYAEQAGAFLILSRMFDLVFIGAWSVVGMMTFRQFQTKKEKTSASRFIDPQMD